MSSTYASIKVCNTFTPKSTENRTHTLSIQLIPKRTASKKQQKRSTRLNRHSAKKLVFNTARSSRFLYFLKKKNGAQRAHFRPIKNRISTKSLSPRLSSTSHRDYNDLCPKAIKGKHTNRQ